MDEKYHFGCQFTADLIAMNTAGEHPECKWRISFLSFKACIESRLRYGVAQVEPEIYFSYCTTCRIG